MAQLSRTEVEEIALLARLHLEPDETARLETELAAILESFGALAAANVEGIAPMTHAVPVDLALRGDQVEPSLSVDDALRGAPKRAGDVFLVPAIVTGKSE